MMAIDRTNKDQQQDEAATASMYPLTAIFKSCLTSQEESHGDQGRRISDSRPQDTAPFPMMVMAG